MVTSNEPSSRRGRAVLTWRRRRVLQAIEDYVADHGCSPSNRDIAKAADLKSASSVLHHLQELKAAGFVSYDPRCPRTVRVLRPGAPRDDPARRRPPGPENLTARKVVWVPVLGQVAAGAPIPPLESVEERIPLPREAVGAEEGLFILKIVGESMTGAGIFSGDWVVVRQQFDPPRDGDLVVAALDGIEVEGTVKTYKKAGGHVWLMPQNPAYTPIPGDRAEIRGKVVAVLRWLA
ncbi:MAG TPA: transcriptional repressor LexA [Streptosporangiaceae bacterium]|nr:transcriptional repressor LexA [Streptosporangiaceae bacterium]